MNPDALLNVLGQTRYVDDLAEPRNLLHAAVVVSVSARGKVCSIESAPALALDPSVRVITARDIPGENQLNHFFFDEQLLADPEWTYRGQPVVLVLAADPVLARRAAALVKVTGEDLPPVFDPREAAAQGLIIGTPHTMRSGDVGAARSRCFWLATGRVESGSQEHVYLETQAAIAFPEEGGRMKLVSGTQSPTGVQAAVAAVLGLAMSEVEVEAPRLGGGFGGKEEQGATWAALAALGARVSGRPVKLVLTRHEDMVSTGKRHPYSTDFTIGLDREGKILLFEADYYQNGGAAADLSIAILYRTLFHAAGAYFIPNVRVTATSCRTNLPPFTAFRGFGAPQAFFVIESAVEAAAEASGIPTIEIQRRNLIAEGDRFHYGMPAKEVRVGRCFDLALERAGASRLRAEIDGFNRTHTAEKKGMAAIPLCFGISFTNIPMNQGASLVNVYKDGSVAVNTGAVEMGQGVHRKITLVAARTFGIPERLVRVTATGTKVVPNTSPTAASTGSDINGMATHVACTRILARLTRYAAERSGGKPEEYSFRDGELFRSGEPAGMTWAQVVAGANQARLDLSEHAFYATPGLFYDEKTESGSPFVYHTYGAAVLTSRLDVLRGTYRIESATIVHDTGDSIDPVVDRGQVEGGFAQGLGWAILEELLYGTAPGRDAGRLLTDTLSTYKLPDMDFMPEKSDITFLPDAPNPLAVLNSKAIGEPPLIYGVAGYFAVLDALKAARPGTEGFFSLPMTPEKALDFLDGRKFAERATGTVAEGHTAERRQR